MEHNLINKIWQKATGYVGFGTLNRFFELENYELTDFVVKGVIHMIHNYTLLKNIDSTGRRLCNPENELMIELYTDFVANEDVIDCVELNEDFYKVVLLTQQMNMITKKVLYMNINKKLL